MAWPNHVFVAQGDVTRICADAIVLSVDAEWSYSVRGQMIPAFEALGRGFPAPWPHVSNGLPAVVPETPGTANGLGATQWFRLDGPQRPHGVLAVATTHMHGQRLTEEEVWLVVGNAVARAVDHLLTDGRREKGRRVLLALPSFWTGAGGQRDRLHAARRAVKSAAAVLEGTSADGDPVDVVFVAYTRLHYQTYLYARQQELGEPAAPLLPPQDLQALSRALDEKRCVPFIGSGFSRPSGYPGWTPLINELNAALASPLPETDDDAPLEEFLQPADRYVEEHGRDVLTPMLQKLYNRPDLAPTLAHYLLLANEPRTVVTTNYDDLLERALRALRLHPDVIIEEADVIRTGQAEGGCVVHFHGDARTGRHMVVTWDDYRCFFARRPAMGLLLEGLLLNQVFLFIGYSLSDWNFRRIHRRISEILRQARRTVYVVPIPRPDAQKRNELLALGGVHLLEMEGETEEEQVHSLARFLDWLASQDVGQGSVMSLAALDQGDPTVHPHLFLAQQDVPPEFYLLQHRLVQAGNALPDLLSQPIEGQHVVLLGALLGFLADRGWQPHAPQAGAVLCDLLETLIDASEPGSALRRRTLRLALRHSIGYLDVKMVQGWLDQLDVDDGRVGAYRPA